MKYLFTLCLLIVSLSGISQWQQTGSRVRYVNGLGIPTRDTAAGVAADSSQILIRPQDSALYVKYKRTWLRVGGGGGSIAGSGTTNYIPKFTSSTAIGNSQIFDNGTNVGIGTTSPATNLEISGSGAIARITGTAGSIPQLQLSSGGIVNWSLRSNVSSSAFAIFQDANERMRITSGGDVGIGTTSPGYKLDVTGDIRATGQMNVGAGSNLSGAFINESDASKSLTIAADPSNFGANSFMRFNVDNTERMRITSGGNALIGTTTDNGTDRLQVSGSASVTSLFGVGTSPSAGTVHIKTTSPSIAIDDNDNAGTAAIRFRPQSASFLTRGSIELVSTGAASPTRFVIASTDTMTFRTNNIERMRITSATGNVLISTTTDNNTDKLQVNGSIQGTGFNQAYTARTSTYTAATTDYFIDCTTGTFTVNLFTAVGNTGRILIIKNSGTGTITVDPNGSQTIDGATTQTLSTQWSRVHIISDGANWKIISN